MIDAPKFPTIEDTTELEEGDTFAPVFDADGLMPAIVSAAETGEAHFWSRSRKALWRKGETSGNTLRIVEIRTDCDQDVLWVTAEMTGAGACCHTGRVSCFYRRIPFGKEAGQKLVTVHADRHFDPADVYGAPSPKTKL